MSKFWKFIPIARLLIPFVIGIVLSSYYPNAIAYSKLTSITTALLILFTISSFFKISAGKSWLQFGYGFILNLSFCIIGYFGALVSNQHFYQNSPLPKDYYWVKIIDTYQEKNQSYKYIAVIKSENSTEHKILIYTPKAFLLYPGDQFAIHTLPQKIEPIKNPEQFNYKRYLWHKNIRYQVYCKTSPKIISTTTHWKKWAMKGRIWALSVFENNLKKDGFALASALVLGDKDYIDSDLMRAFSKAGATHVLAVSGLHVGIVFLIVQFLFNRLPKSQNLSRLKVLTGLLIIWTYAYLTGLSASVCRAATMFSFVLLGELFRKKSNVFNNIASSAFILLIISPYILMEVGFQLSYLAVLGIVYFQPKFNTLLCFNSWLPRKIWELTTVSISAQLTTFPLALLYFHQFPNYFLVSNLLVIPITFALVPLGLFTLILNQVSVLSEVLFWILQQLLNGLKWSVYWLNQLNWSSSQEIHLSTAETWLLYALIAFGTLYWMHRKMWSKYCCIILILYTIFINLKEVAIQQEHKELVIYDTAPHLSIDIVEGQHLFHFGTHPTPDKDFELYFFEHFRWKQNILRRDSLSLLNGWLFSSDFNVFVVDSSTSILPSNSHIDAIVLLPKTNLELLKIGLDDIPLIIGGRWSKKTKQKLQLKLKKLQLVCYDLESKGAYSFKK